MFMAKIESALTPATLGRDPFAMLRQMTSEFDRLFGESLGPALRWPAVRTERARSGFTWAPGIDVFEKDGRLVTKVDLPGTKKEDVKVEVTDGHLVISGERKSEAEEKKDQFYHCEREYGSFFRAVPLPDGVKIDDITATFTDGVLEVSVPLPVKAEQGARRVEIQESAAPAKKTAA
jgi:HSP20 family protein